MKIALLFRLYLEVTFLFLFQVWSSALLNSRSRGAGGQKSKNQWKKRIFYGKRFSRKRLFFQNGLECRVEKNTSYSTCYRLSNYVPRFNLQTPVQTQRTHLTFHWLLEKLKGEKSFVTEADRSQRTFFSGQKRKAGFWQAPNPRGKRRNSMEKFPKVRFVFTCLGKVKHNKTYWRW